MSKILCDWLRKPVRREIRDYKPYASIAAYIEGITNAPNTICAMQDAKWALGESLKEVLTAKDCRDCHELFMRILDCLRDEYKKEDQP